MSIESKSWLCLFRCSLFVVLVSFGQTDGSGFQSGKETFLEMVRVVDRERKRRIEE